MPTKITQVNEKLYRGNAIFSPIKAYRLKRKGITQVIDLRHENNIFVKLFKYLEMFYCKKLNIKYVRKDFFGKGLERVPNKDFFDNINEQINSSDKTYIHCHYGKHRTGFAVAMYQKSIGIPDEEIINQLRNNDWSHDRGNLLNIFLQRFFNK